jgi:hypothetical protein
MTSITSGSNDLCPHKNLLHDADAVLDLFYLECEPFLGRGFHQPSLYRTIINGECGESTNHGDEDKNPEVMGCRGECEEDTVLERGSERLVSSILV